MRTSLLAAVAAALVCCSRPAAAQEPAPTPPRPPVEAGTYEVSAVEERPMVANARDVTRELARHYPPELRDAGVQGEALLRFRINRDGRVDAGTVQVDEATHPLFGEAAARIAPKMRFRPARTLGRPVAVWIQVPLYFRIAAAAEAKPDSAAPAAP